MTVTTKKSILLLITTAHACFTNVTRPCDPDRGYVDFGPSSTAEVCRAACEFDGWCVEFTLVPGEYKRCYLCSTAGEDTTNAACDVGGCARAPRGR